eukprot:scaffold2280_cov430-Prasinococcus_capsulatus_cf.AAC.27
MYLYAEERLYSFEASIDAAQRSSLPTIGSCASGWMENEDAEVGPCSAAFDAVHVAPRNPTRGPFLPGAFEFWARYLCAACPRLRLHAMHAQQECTTPAESKFGDADRVSLPDALDLRESVAMYD